MARTRRTLVTLVVALALVLAIPAVVIAAHGFVDVPDTNVFTGDIEWLADNQVTRGCNPPTNDRFCPGDNVSREQMAAFMRRLAGASGVASSQVTEVHPPVGYLSGPTLLEVARITVSARSDAAVLLSGHAYIERTGGDNVQYVLSIHADSCDGDELGVGYARLSNGTGFNGESIAVTAADQVTGETDYVLCGARPVGSSQGAVHAPGLNAIWSPTA